MDSKYVKKAADGNNFPVQPSFYTDQNISNFFEGINYERLEFSVMFLIPDCRLPLTFDSRDREVRHMEPAFEDFLLENFCVIG